MVGREVLSCCPGPRTASRLENSGSPHIHLLTRGGHPRHLPPQHPPTRVEEVTLGHVDALAAQLVHQLQDASGDDRLWRSAGWKGKSGESNAHCTPWLQGAAGNRRLQRSTGEREGGWRAQLRGVALGAAGGRPASCMPRAAATCPAGAAPPCRLRLPCYRHARWRRSPEPRAAGRALPCGRWLCWQRRGGSSSLSAQSGPALQPGRMQSVGCNVAEQQAAALPRGLTCGAAGCRRVAAPTRLLPAPAVHARPRATSTAASCKRSRHIELLGITCHTAGSVVPFPSRASQQHSASNEASSTHPARTAGCPWSGWAACR